MQISPPSTNAPFQLLCVAFVAAALASCGGGGTRAQGPGSGTRGNPAPGSGGENRAIAVRVAPVQRGTIDSVYSTSATVRADRRATVIARTRGVIRRLLVEEGDRVAEGQALAELENDEQRIAADRARTTKETREREQSRLEDLLEQGLVSEDEYERARRDAIDAAHALDLAELELARTVIRAPFAGIVLMRHLDVGATVADGTAVYDLADLSPLYVDVTIPERHVASLAPGRRVNLTADAGGERIAATIERIAPSVDTATGTVKVTVAVEGAASLRPGAFVRVDIVADTHHEAMIVPRSALVAEGRRWNLFRLAEGGGTVEQVEVELGFEEGDRVEIAGTVGNATLAAGDPVVVAGAPALSDAAAVRVVEGDDPAPPGPEATPATPAGSGRAGKG